MDREGRDVAGRALLGDGLHGLEGHAEVAAEHRRDLRDRAVLEVVEVELARLDGALALLAEVLRAVGDLRQLRAHVRVRAAADLAEARDPVIFSHSSNSCEHSKNSV